MQQKPHTPWPPATATASLVKPRSPQPRSRSRPRRSAQIRADPGRDSSGPAHTRPFPQLQLRWRHATLPARGVRRARGRAGRPRLDMARRWTCPAAVQPRRQSISPGPASRHRHRRAHRDRRPCPRLGAGHVRRPASNLRPDGHDPDRGRLLGHARPPRVDRGREGRRNRRGRCRRDRRTVRRARGGRAVRLSRRPCHRRPGRLPGPALLPAAVRPKRSGRTGPSPAGPSPAGPGSAAACSAGAGPGGFGCAGARPADRPPGGGVRAFRPGRSLDVRGAGGAAGGAGRPPGSAGSRNGTRRDRQARRAAGAGAARSHRFACPAYDARGDTGRPRRTRRPACASPCGSSRRRRWSAAARSSRRTGRRHRARRPRPGPVVSGRNRVAGVDNPRRLATCPVPATTNGEPARGAGRRGRPARRRRHGAEHAARSRAWNGRGPNTARAARRGGDARRPRGAIRARGPGGGRSYNGTSR